MKQYLNSQLEGKLTELLFIKEARSRSYLVEQSSSYDNKMKHIDVILINGPPKVKYKEPKNMEELLNWAPIWPEYKTIDIKNAKRINRNDTNTADYLLILEYKNIGGNDGWLFGKADALAFKVHDSFYIMDREDLVELACGIVPTTSTVHRPPDTRASFSYKEKALTQHELYGRFERKDAMAFIKLNDVVVATVAKWSINKLHIDWYNNLMSMLQNNQIEEVKELLA